MNDKDSAAADGGLRIGAVSRITDVPVDTLRAWERRYDIVTPRRSGSSARLYSPEDVERLKLIKRLIGHGHAIGSLAGLALGELQAQLALHGDRPAADAAADISSVLFYGDAVELEAEFAAAKGIHVIGVERSWSAFEAEVFNTMP
ncbi:MAG: MerR family transcriptional regulator, partial [Gammaproteobacteria bacterium]|nr:MerR family transcriptional regulator [Gammaproteobacteria bacterium]